MELVRSPRIPRPYQIGYLFRPLGTRRDRRPRDRAQLRDILVACLPLNPRFETQPARNRRNLLRAILDATWNIIRPPSVLFPNIHPMTGELWTVTRFNSSRNLMPLLPQIFLAISSNSLRHNVPDCNNDRFDTQIANDASYERRAASPSRDLSSRHQSSSVSAPFEDGRYRMNHHNKQMFSPRPN